MFNTLIKISVQALGKRVYDLEDKTVKIDKEFQSDVYQMSTRIVKLQKRIRDNEVIIDALMVHLGVEAELVKEHVEVHLKSFNEATS